MIIGFLVLTTTLIAISVIDLRTQRIPDGLSLPLVVAGLIWSHRYGTLPLSDHLLGTAAGFVSLWLFGTVYFRLRGREGLGMGDAKLFAATGAWIGWQLLPLTLLAAALGGLAYALKTRMFVGQPTGGEIAFGPWIAAALWLQWTLGLILP